VGIQTASTRDFLERDATKFDAYDLTVQYKEAKSTKQKRGPDKQSSYLNSDMQSLLRNRLNPRVLDLKNGRPGVTVGGKTPRKSLVRLMDRPPAARHQVQNQVTL